MGEEGVRQMAWAAGQTVQYRDVSCIQTFQGGMQAATPSDSSVRAPGRPHKRGAVMST